jgi:hypothetical protein
MRGTQQAFCSQKCEMRIATFSGGIVSQFCKGYISAFGNKWA